MPMTRTAARQARPNASCVRVNPGGQAQHVEGQSGQRLLTESRSAPAEPDNWLTRDWEAPPPLGSAAAFSNVLLVGGNLSCLCVRLYWVCGWTERDSMVGDGTEASDVGSSSD
jgi:hypothetical protein